MLTRLSFESGNVNLALKQIGSAETRAVITLQVSFNSNVSIYMPDHALLNNARWTMAVLGPDLNQGEPDPLGSLTYRHSDGVPDCAIVIYQSAARFHTLLEMFKGGHVSEITIEADGIVEMTDYSRRWVSDPTLPLALHSVSFEFPLPQRED